MSDLLLTDIFDVKDLQKFQDAFVATSEISLGFSDADGVAVTKHNSKCELCKRIHKGTREGLRWCTEVFHSLQSLLKKAGLIYETREKNYIYYQLNTSVLEDVLAWLAGLKGETGHEIPQPETADSDFPADSPARPGGTGPVEPPAGPGAHTL